MGNLVILCVTARWLLRLREAGHRLPESYRAAFPLVGGWEKNLWKNSSW